MDRSNRTLKCCLFFLFIIYFSGLVNSYLHDNTFSTVCSPQFIYEISWTCPVSACQLRQKVILRTHEGKQVSEKNNPILTALDLITCLNQIQILLLTCASTSELPFDLSTMSFWFNSFGLQSPGKQNYQFEEQ